MAETPATSLEVQDDVAIVHVQLGDLDENHVKAVRDELATACQTHSQPFVVDLSRVKFVPSLSLGVLVRIASEFRARGQRLVLAGLQPTVRQVLAITKLDRVFEIHQSIEAAIKAIRP